MRIEIEVGIEVEIEIEIEIEMEMEGYRHPYRHGDQEEGWMRGACGHADTHNKRTPTSLDVRVPV